jgi:hypothetical protein
MNRLNTTALLLLLALLPACGQQLVEFPNGKTDGGTAGAGDSAGFGGSGGAGNGDAGNADGRGSDVGAVDAASTEAGITDAAKTEAGLIDAAIIDGGLIDVVSGIIDASGIDAPKIDSAGMDTANADMAMVDIGSSDSASMDLASPDTACSQAPVVLGAAGNFAVLAGSTVTSTGPTSVTGDLGVSPGSAVTGFPPGTLVGTMQVANPTSAQGVADLTTAYNDAAGRTLCAVTVAGNLGGQTLTPGLYKSTSSLEISSGDLTLDGQGNADAVFIFQMASTLTTTPGRQVVLSGGAKSANVYWQVGTSATIGTTSAFKGTVMADQAITMGTGATLNGRLLARIAAVTLDSNTIVKPTP